jgi:retron-type reverse transcriptase
MSLWDLLFGWLWPRRTSKSVAVPPSDGQGSPPAGEQRHAKIRLQPLRRNAARTPRPKPEVGANAVAERPYAFARPCVFGGYLDLTGGHDAVRLEQQGLPNLRTPQEIADWLEVPLGQLAWLVRRFDESRRPPDVKSAHYHFRWVPKRSGGQRLIEIPKLRLRLIQQRILRDVLDRVAPHSAAHGFITGRSIRTNAEPHTGKRVVVKFDLENFYPAVTYSRVVAIFRSLGYSREAALWLGQLTTSSLPYELVRQKDQQRLLAPYLSRHLPQGASTSPALANLSAFTLDLRLSGLARSFGAAYTRYADDLTFSGDDAFLRSLSVFIPLVTQIVSSERFRANRRKRRVVRSSQRQQVTGVVVNSHVNVSRKDYDRLKATLVNCVRRGPSTQNHDRHADFASHLRGRIAHVRHLNPARGEKLLHLFQQIRWDG